MISVPYFIQKNWPSKVEPQFRKSATVWGYVRKLSAFLCLILIWTVPGTHAADETWMAVDINTVGNPRGYYEFLPSAYIENPNQEFPVVIFFHGKGPNGDGTVADENGNGLGDDLPAILNNAVPTRMKDVGDDLRAYMELNDVIVLCPQNINNWWTTDLIRPFLDFAKNHYRIDTRRMYLTGLSAGCSGVYHFMNNDPRASEIAAFVVCANRGFIDGNGSYLAERSAYWGLTSRGDQGFNVIDSVNKLAGHLLTGTPGSPTNVDATYPGSNINRTAHFDAVTGWSWETGVYINKVNEVVTDDSNIKATMFTGKAHNSWSRTYDSYNMWDWMLSWQKPDLSISSPTEGQVIPSGSTVTLSATASTPDGMAIVGDDVVWESSIDGALGTGVSLVASNLSIGVHAITCGAYDRETNQMAMQTITLSVVNASDYVVRYDFGSIDHATSPSWNNITDKVWGSVDNAVDVNGMPTGVRADITSPFASINSGGVIASTLFPETTQRDSMAVDANGAEVVFSGLNPSKAYTFTFFASRTGSGTRVTVYDVIGANSGSASLDVMNNTDQSAVVPDIFPDATGRTVLQVSRAVGSNWGYLGAVSISTGDAINLAPSVNAGADRILTLPTASVILEGSVVDDGLPVGSTVSSSWSQLSGPGTASFDDSSNLNATVTLPEIGVYVLELSSNDSELTSTDTVTLELREPDIIPNEAPIVNAGDDLAVTLPTDSVNLSGMVTDDGLPSGGTLTTTWSKQSGPGIVAFSAANALNTTATFPEAGVYVLELQASDSELSTVDTLTVTVETEPLSGSLFFVAAVNAADGEYTAVDDTVFSSDASDGHFTTSISKDQSGTIAGTSDPALHARYRWSSSGFSYNLPVTEAGTYVVDLYFADSSAVGNRQFNVEIEGGAALNNYDISGTAGRHTAIVETFQVGVIDGALNIDFLPGAAGNPRIDAIRVHLQVPDAVVAAVNAAGDEYTAIDSTVFSSDAADGHFTTSISRAQSGTITGTNDPTLHATYRWSSSGFSYNLPIADGTYEVDLYFADSAAVGNRQFNVSIEGGAVLTNYDISAIAGRYTSIIESFQVTITDGVLNIDFLPGAAGNPRIDAIKIRQ